MRRTLAMIGALLCADATAAVPQLDLAVTMNPLKLEFSAQADLSLEAAEKFDFALAPGFEVDKIEVDGNAMPVRRLEITPSRRYEIPLPGRLAMHMLRVAYHGRLVPLELATLDRRGVQQELPPVASKAGSFLPAGSGWYPDPGVPFTCRLSIRTPADQIAVMPGTPVKEEVHGGGRNAVFSLPQQVEGVDLMVGPYVVKEKLLTIGEPPVRVRTYFHRELADLADGYLDAAARYITRYAKQIGAYPYTHFSIVSSPLPTGYGMPSLTYLGREVLRLPFIRDTSLGHEVLHNWWGNGVFVDASRGNWSEGLTTFMADYAYKEDAGPDAAKEMRYGWLRDFAALAPNTEQPLSAFRARDHTASAAVGYGKAAMMFYALRGRIGADAFSAALRAFWLQHQFSTAGFDDLRRAFEQASGQHLAGFFDQWLDQTGAPQLSVASATFDGSQLHVQLAQSLPERSDVVPVRAYYDGGTEEFAIVTKGATTEAAFAPRARPTSVAVDPDFTVWRGLAPSEASPIVRDLVAAKRLAVLALDDALKAPALAFAKAIGEGEAQSVSHEQAAKKAFLIVAGSAKAVDAWLAAEKLAARPARVAGGDTQLWRVDGPNSHVLAVSLPAQADDARAALDAAGKRLPHLARYSWVTFEKGQTAQRGTWPAESPRVSVK